jgi:hypothetical protein
MINVANRSPRTNWSKPHIVETSYTLFFILAIKIQPHVAATLYPLHVPPVPWHAMGLDYSTRLRVSNSFDSVLILANRLTPVAHFLPYTESIIAYKIATLFCIGSLYKLRGLPRVLVSDRHPNFVRGFWQTLWRHLGTRLNMSSNRHPKTAGLTEHVNNTFHVALFMLL